MTHSHSFNPFLSKSGYEKRESKHGLVELRRVNHCFMIFVLTPQSFMLIQLQIETTIHRTLFGVDLLRIRSLVVVL